MDFFSASTEKFLANLTDNQKIKVNLAPHSSCVLLNQTFPTQARMYSQNRAVRGFTSSQSEQ